MVANAIALVYSQSHTHMKVMVTCGVSDVPSLESLGVHEGPHAQAQAQAQAPAPSQAPHIPDSGPPHQGGSLTNAIQDAFGAPQEQPAPHSLPPTSLDNPHPYPPLDLTGE